MLLLAIATLALIAAVVTAFAVAIGWAQSHARTAGSVPAPIAPRRRRRPF